MHIDCWKGLLWGFILRSCIWIGAGNAVVWIDVWCEWCDAMWCDWFCPCSFLHLICAVVLVLLAFVLEWMWCVFCFCEMLILRFAVEWDSANVCVCVCVCVCACVRSIIQSMFHIWVHFNRVCSMIRCLLFVMFLHDDAVCSRWSLETRWCCIARCNTFVCFWLVNFAVV